MASTFDFDAAWAEDSAKVEPPVITVLGETFELPPRLPARIVLFYERARLDPETARRDATYADLIDMLTPLVGGERVERWLAAGLDTGKLGQILQQSMMLYRGSAELPEDAEGKAPAATASPGT